MSQSCSSSATSMVISFIAGLAVGVGAILIFEQTLKEENNGDYETDQLFV